MAITYIPRQKDWTEQLNESISPYLQFAFQKMLEQKFQDQARQKNMEQAYTEAERMGLLNKTAIPQTANIPSMDANPVPVRPDPTIPPQFQYSLRQQPGMQTSMKFSESGIPQFGQETLNPYQYGNVPIININQEGKPEQIGTVPRNAKILTPSQMETPEMKQQRDLETTQKKKSQEVSGEMKSIDNMIDVVWKQADSLIPAQEGLSQAATTGVGRKFGTTIPGRILGMGDEKAVAFSEFQEGTLSMLIRSLGEKGMLTDQDIKRARQFEPSFYDTPNIRALKRNSMSEFLKSKVSAYTSGETQTQGVPSVGQSFNGEKVVSVRRIE